MVDRKKVIGNLEGLTWDDWHVWHSDSEVRTIAEDALTLLKEQNERIETLEHQLETITRWRANAGAFD